MEAFQMKNHRNSIFISSFMQRLGPFILGNRFVATRARQSCPTSTATTNDLRTDGKMLRSDVRRDSYKGGRCMFAKVIIAAACIVMVSGSACRRNRDVNAGNEASNAVANRESLTDLNLCYVGAVSRRANPKSQSSSTRRAH